MLSVVVIGRSDNHGHNLHKRVALSLNSIAEQLNQENDEIIFVDWNTPDHLPTLSESVSDTLTTQCLKTLRLVRVRPELHRRNSGDSKRPIIEAMARNVGIRRANPANTWILNTNTDILIVPRGQRTLSEFCSTANTGHWFALPRYSIPDSYWEGLPRTAPDIVTSTLRADALQLHFEERTTWGREMPFDAPGDFQLVPREILMRLRGFDERMIYGWHVDANLCVRLWEFGVKPKSAEADFSIFHCEHTRTQTHFGEQHKTNRSEDFVPPKAEYWNQRTHDAWGLSEEDLHVHTFSPLTLADPRTIMLQGERGFAAGQVPVTVNAKSGPYLAGVRNGHIIPFVIDALITLWPGARVAFVGASATDLCDILSKRFTTHFIDSDALSSLNWRMDGRLGSFDAVVIDFRPKSATAAADFGLQLEWVEVPLHERAQVLQTLKSLLVVLRKGRRRRIHHKSAQTFFVLINASGNRLESITQGLLTSAPSTFNARVRVGRMTTRRRTRAIRHSRFVQAIMVSKFRQDLGFSPLGDARH